MIMIAVFVFIGWCPARVDEI